MRKQGDPTPNLGGILSVQMNSISRQSLKAYPRQAALPALPRTFISDWAYHATTTRDLRLDLLRGLAVVVMVIDHVGGASWLYFLTGGNAFWVSAAEGFVFVSGVVAGMVYGALARRNGLKAALVKLLRRAWTLYTLTVALTLLFEPLSIYFQLRWAKGVSLGHPVLFAWNVLTLRQNFFLVDIPLLYTLLLLAALFGLTLLYYGHPGLVLAGSSALWLALQIAPTQVAILWPIQAYGFNFAAWQLLFFVGMTLGYHREALALKLERIPRWLYFFLSAVLMFWLVVAYVISGGTFGITNTDVETALFAKRSLGFGRLVAGVIVFQFAFLAVTLLWKPIKMAGSWFLLPLGQNSLYSYTVHVALAGVVAVLEARLGLGPSAAVSPSVQLAALWMVNMIVQLLAVLLIWVMVRSKFLFRIIPR